MSGAGFVCYYVLDCLATHALKVNRSQLPRPQVHAEEDVAPEILENNNEIILEKVEEEQMALFNEDDDDNDDSHDGRFDLNFRGTNRIRDVLLLTPSGIGNTTNGTIDNENWK